LERENAALRKELAEQIARQRKMETVDLLQEIEKLKNQAAAEQENRKKILIEYENRFEHYQKAKQIVLYFEFFCLFCLLTFVVCCIN
jgi:hypothetical protein